MQENIITWNFPNWVTITLMAAISYFVLGAVIGHVNGHGGEE